MFLLVEVSYVNEYKPGTVARVIKYLQRDRTFGTGHPLVALYTLLTCIDQLRVEVSHGASYMHGTLTCIDQLRVEVSHGASYMHGTLTCIDQLRVEVSHGASYMAHFVQSQ